MGILDSLLKSIAGVTQNDESNSDADPIEKANPRSPNGKVDYTEVLEPEKEPRSLVWDPFSVVEQMGYKDKPTQLSYGALDMMVWQNPIVQGIIMTRINQVATFAVPQKNVFKPGYAIVHADPDFKIKEAERKFMRQMEELVLYGGVGGPSYFRDSFEVFLRKTVRDSLTFDQMCAEIVPNRKGLPAAFYAVDAATIRLADSIYTTHVSDPDQIKTVQVYDSVVINEYKAHEMMFGVRNPRTSTKSYGYGTSELEMLLKVVTAFLWSWEYNQNFFAQGTVAKGILNIKGSMNRVQLKSFRKHWYQMVSGVENAFRSPVLNTDKDGGVEWVDMEGSKRDMEFSNWMDFLIKVTSAVYQMDPVELGFKYGNTGQATSLFESSHSGKVMKSKDKGLRPLMAFIEQQINDYIIRPIDPDFKFKFIGLEAQTQEDLAQLNQMRVKTTHTLNELRAEQGEDPLPHGDIVLDPVYVQYITQKEAMEQQAAMGGQPGQPGVPGAPGMPPPGGDGQPPGKEAFSNLDLEKLMDDISAAESDKGDDSKKKDDAKSAKEEVKKSDDSYIVEIEI